MGMQRPLGQAKKGVGHFVFPLPESDRRGASLTGELKKFKPA